MSRNGRGELNGAQAANLPIGMATVASVLDAMPSAAAVLDADGVVVVINSVWKRFAEINGGSVEATGVGVNYLDICEHAAADGDRSASAVHRGVHAVLASTQERFSFEYPCPSPLADSWFLLEASRLSGASDPFALVVHTDVSDRVTLREEVRRGGVVSASTGLPTRAALTERLQNVLARTGERHVGIVFIALDGLRSIERRHGASLRQSVVADVAARLQRIAMPTDLVGHLARETFVIVREESTTESTRRLEAEVRNVLRQEHLLGSHAVRVDFRSGNMAVRYGGDVRSVLVDLDLQSRTPPPAAVTSDPDAAPNLTSRPTVAPTRTRVLLVGDSAADWSLTAAGLESTGSFSIRSASSLHAALEAVVADPPDCVLLELGLPDADGLEGLQAIRHANADIAVVVLAGRDDELARGALAMGAQDYLAKDKLEAAQLQRSVTYAVDRCRLQSRAACCTPGPTTVEFSNHSVMESSSRTVLGLSNSSTKQPSN
jgi:PleD family two-component response regulator